MFGVATPVWRTIVNPEERILYAMASGDEAEKTLGVVREILKTSETLAHFFPNRVLDPKNKNHKDQVNYIKLNRSGKYREGSIEARGTDSRMTGGHFTWQILDDLIDEKMKDSVVQQQAAINFMKLNDAKFVTPGKDIELIVGTRWPGLFYDWLLDESGLIDDYEVLLIGCRVDDRYRQFLADLGLETTLEDGDPVWPEHFDNKTLNKIQRKSPYDFDHQWLNKKTSEQNRRFRREDFMNYNHGGDGNSVIYYRGDSAITVPYHRLYRTLTIDPATGEGANTDESAITVCGFDKKSGNIFILEAWDGKVLPFDLINKTIELAKKWEPYAICPEDVAFQKVLKHFLKQEMAQQQVSFRIRPIKVGSIGKGARILDALQPFVENHQLYVLRSQKKLVDEAVGLQVVGGKVVGKSPNLIDSVSMHREFWKGREVWEPEPEDDIPTVRRHKITPAYGLECTT